MYNILNYMFFLFYGFKKKRGQHQLMMPIVPHVIKKMSAVGGFFVQQHQLIIIFHVAGTVITIVLLFQIDQQIGGGVPGGETGQNTL